MTLMAAAMMVLAAGPAGAAPPPGSPAQARALLERAIAFRTVEGPGNQTPTMAAWLREQLVANGFAPADVTVTPLGTTAYLVARLPGRDPALPPLVLSGHMDVAPRPAAGQQGPAAARQDP